jgi:hypothetical protein
MRHRPSLTRRQCRFPVPSRILRRWGYRPILGYMMEVGSTALTHSPPLPASFRAEERTVCASQEEARLEQEELNGCYRSPGLPWAAPCSRALPPDGTRPCGQSNQWRRTSGAPAARGWVHGQPVSRATLPRRCDAVRVLCRAVRRHIRPGSLATSAPGPCESDDGPAALVVFPLWAARACPTRNAARAHPGVMVPSKRAPVRQLGRSHWYQQSALPLHLQQAPPSPLTASPADRGAADAFPETSRLAANRCGNFRRGVTARLSRSRPWRVRATGEAAAKAAAAVHWACGLVGCAAAARAAAPTRRAPLPSGASGRSAPGAASQRRLGRAAAATAAQGAQGADIVGLGCR